MDLQPRPRCPGWHRHVRAGEQHDPRNGPDLVEDVENDRHETAGIATTEAHGEAVKFASTQAPEAKEFLAHQSMGQPAQRY